MRLSNGLRANIPVLETVIRLEGLAKKLQDQGDVDSHEADTLAHAVAYLKESN